MVKNIRETILLLVFFVIVIVILQITSNEQRTIETNTKIPSSCTLLVRFDVKKTSKKLLITELYSHRASQLLKIIKKSNDGISDGDELNPLLEFIENLEYNDQPLDFLSLIINQKQILFLRSTSPYKTTNKNIFSSDHNYLYVQLNELDMERNEILKAINNTKTYEIPSSLDSDIQMYEVQKNKLKLAAYFCISKQIISVTIPNKSKGNPNNKIKPKGLHFHTNTTLLSSISNNIKAVNKLKNISINYFGLNIYDDPILFPNADFLLEFKEEIDQNGLVDFIKPIFKKSAVSIVPDKEDSEYLQVGSIKFKIEQVNNYTFYLSTNNRNIELKQTNQPIEISGDLSQLFNFNDNGWKGMLAKEIISSVSFLNEIKVMFVNSNPIETEYKNQKTVISLSLKNNQSIYAHLISILGSF